MLWGMAAIALCYSDRVNISVAIVHMADEYGWTMQERGGPMSAFFYGYICSQLPGGWLGSQIGYKQALTVAASAWAVLTFLTAPAANHSTKALVAVRFALGLAEGATYPCVYGYISTGLSSPSDRSSGIATVLSGSPVGTVVAFLVCPSIAAHLGWRAVFYVWGVVGAAFAFCWHCYAPDPAAAGALAAAAAAETGGTGTGGAPRSGSSTRGLSAANNGGDKRELTAADTIISSNRAAAPSMLRRVPPYYRGNSTTIIILPRQARDKRKEHSTIEPKIGVRCFPSAQECSA